jgi:hypothetical protein
MTTRELPYFFRMPIKVLSFEVSLSCGSGVSETVFAGADAAGGKADDVVEAIVDKEDKESRSSQHTAGRL